MSTEKARDAFQQWMDKTSYIKISFPGGAADRALRELAEIIALIPPPEPPLPWLAIDLELASKYAQIHDDARTFLAAQPQPARNDIATLKAMIRLTALRWVPGITHEQIDAHIDAALAGKAAAIEPQPTHPDDVAIDAFAAAMKAKMAASRAKGRSGWEGCPVAELSAMLRDHVAKGDPLDVANFAMMIWHTGGPMARIEGQPAPDVVHVRWEWQQDRGVRTDVLHPSLILFAGALQGGQITYSSAGKVFRADIWTWEYWREFDTLEAAKSALLAALNGGE